MGHSPSKNTFITLTCTHNRNINHQGLTSLFLFGSASCLTFVASRPPAVASAFIIIAFKRYLHLKDLRRRRRPPNKYLLLFAILAMRHLWQTLGKRIPLLMAMFVAFSSEEELVELSSESHSHPMCASPPFFLL
jgi:hypothetical protein